MFPLKLTEVVVNVNVAGVADPRVTLAVPGAAVTENVPTFRLIGTVWVSPPFPPTPVSVKVYVPGASVGSVLIFIVVAPFAPLIPPERKLTVIPAGALGTDR
jgi:hypothetical protein